MRRLLLACATAAGRGGGTAPNGGLTLARCLPVARTSSRCHYGAASAAGKGAHHHQHHKYHHHHHPNNKPGNETYPHWQTKQRLLQLLRPEEGGKASLDVVVPCKAGEDHRGRFWHCRNTRLVKGWASGWDKVATEFSLSQIGARLDIALLYSSHFKIIDCKEESYVAREQARERARSTQPSVNKTLLQQAEEEEAAQQHDYSYAVDYYSPSARKEYLLAMHDFLERWKAANPPHESPSSPPDTRKEYAFGRDLTSYQRYAVHQMAEAMGLWSKSIGPPDARRLLISNRPFLEAGEGWKAEGVVAVEVFHTSEVTPAKVRRLDAANIPWLEIEAFRSSSTLLQNIEPLRAIRTSQRWPNGETKWTCDSCAEGLQDRLVFSRLAAIHDFFLATPSKGGYGKLLRKVFSLLEDPSQPRFYLVEGGFSVLNDRHIYEQVPTLLHTAHSTNLDSIKVHLEERLKLLQMEGGGPSHPQLEWPGKAPSEIFSNNDPLALRSAVFATPDSMYPSIERIFPTSAYKWDRKARNWLPSHH
ncbi:hypothetical protein QOT17_020800 [Balamuthia mandrillaris]